MEMILNTAPPDAIDQYYDVVVIGSGFGSLFFVHRLIQLRPDTRVLILEWGRHNAHDWQLANQRHSPTPHGSTIDSSNLAKPWNFTIGLGGGTNCWFGHTPRLHPNDFRTASLYKVGRDWPISYEELEEHYLAAERIMSVSGPDDSQLIYPRSAPYPQPPHRMTAVDRIMKEYQPHQHFVLPTARARIATDQRAACCASARCYLCPVNAKFTALNGFQTLFGHPTVTTVLEARVLRIDTQGGVACKAIFDSNGKEHQARGDLFVLGANAIHSPHILLRSGFDNPITGRGLHEQLGFGVEVLLDGLDNFDGSTITTGVNTSLLDGAFRRYRGGALVYFENRWMYGLRKEFGRWRQTLSLVVAVEDLPHDDNRVLGGDEGRPRVDYSDASPYAYKGVKAARENLPKVLSPLPVEDIVFRGMRPTESHLQGTIRMGTERSNSVVDANLVHHDCRNLIVVGTAVFPTCAAGNPSLTAAALALRAADKII
jgi:choline dehydrogenase-like flavoprotein